MPRARAQDLLLVSKSHKKTIDLFKAGASLEERTGYEIGALLSKATIDRIEFSQKLRLAAKAATTGSNRTPTGPRRSATGVARRDVIRVTET
jgi:hypothetical protein